MSNLERGSSDPIFKPSNSFDNLESLTHSFSSSKAVDAKTEEHRATADSPSPLLERMASAKNVLLIMDTPENSPPKSVEKNSFENAAKAEPQKKSVIFADKINKALATLFPFKKGSVTPPTPPSSPSKSPIPVFKASATSIREALTPVDPTKINLDHLDLDPTQLRMFLAESQSEALIGTGFETSSFESLDVLRRTSETLRGRGEIDLADKFKNLHLFLLNQAHLKIIRQDPHRGVGGVEFKQAQIVAGLKNLIKVELEFTKIALVNRPSAALVPPAIERSNLYDVEDKVFNLVTILTDPRSQISSHHLDGVTMQLKDLSTNLRIQNIQDYTRVPMTFEEEKREDIALLADQLVTLLSLAAKEASPRKPVELKTTRTLVHSQILHKIDQIKLKNAKDVLNEEIIKYNTQDFTNQMFNGHQNQEISFYKRNIALQSMINEQTQKISDISKLLKISLSKINN